MFGPSWWHRHGSKLVVESLDTADKILKLSATAARLYIRGTVDPNEWKVSWFVKYSQSESVLGHLIFSTESLEAAFGLRELDGISPEWIARYGTNVSKQGRYIRLGAFLNIPGPGTGHDGDANISIEVSEQIRNAVKLLIGKGEKD